jgi:hypothetical protein
VPSCGGVAKSSGGDWRIWVKWGLRFLVTARRPNMSRTSITLEVSSPEQAALLRHFHALVVEMEQLALSAPEGQVLDRCEAAIVERGRQVNRQVLQQAVQQRIEALEKKGRRCGVAPAVGRGKTAAADDAKS